MGFSNDKRGEFSEFLGTPYMPVKLWRTVSSKQTSYFYFVEYINFQNVDYVTNKILKFAKKYKTFFIVLQNFHEGYAYKNFHYIEEFVKKYELEKKVIYICGHYDTETEYDIWCSRRNIKKSFYVVSYNIFFDTLRTGYLHHNTKFSIEKTKWFCCLNHRPHFHRHAAVTYMDYLNMLETGLVTCHDKNYQADTIDTPDNIFENSIKYLENVIDPKYYKILKKQFLITEQKLPLVYDIHDLSDGCQPNNFNPDIYNPYLINLVTETYYFNHWNIASEMFITEKTIKPLMTNQIFIIIGPRGILKKLKEFGFKTFNEFFDESYDDLPDTLRVFKAVETLKHVMETYDLQELDEKTREIRKHNFELFKTIKFNINLETRLGI